MGSLKNIPEQNAYFTGRAAYLANIQGMLRREGKVYLVGYGGTGKTQLGKAFAYNHENDYDLIWWFDLRGDLIVQYENLLTHLSNSDKFKKFLSIDVKNIAPGVIVDFTYSLLNSCDCHWLLIFDNLLPNQELKLPVVNPQARKHIIITTRETELLGDNILVVGPFSDEESDQYLRKVHPGESSEEISKLSKILHNYPLALAQTSEEILMSEKGIEGYLAKRSVMGNRLSCASALTQEYNKYYREVLSQTLQDLEDKDKKAAEVLYMLTLLKTDITKKLFSDIFKDSYDKELVILGRYGVVQTISQGEEQVLSIHDVIREEAGNSFNAKKPKDKKAIISDLSKYISNHYSEKNLANLLKNAGMSNGGVAQLHAFINASLDNNVVNENVIDVINAFLLLNDTRFNRYASNALYQEVSEKVYHKITDKSVKTLGISPMMGASLYAHIVLLESILKSTDELSKFEGGMLQALKAVEDASNVETLFFIYARICEFYLILGDFHTASSYLKKADLLLNCVSDDISLAEYWYTKGWYNRDTRNYAEGINAIDHYLEYSNKLPANMVGKFLTKRYKIEMGILFDQKEAVAAELEEAIAEARKYYNNIPSNILSKLEFTKAMMLFYKGKYKAAEEQCQRALEVARKFFHEEMISQTQSNVYLMLGRLCALHNQDDLAIAKFKEAIKYYDSSLSLGRIVQIYEYGELLSELCFMYHKQKNYQQSRVYFQKLVTNFGLDHELVEKLIKKLPAEYMYQINPNIS